MICPLLFKKRFPGNQLSCVDGHRHINQTASFVSAVFVFETRAKLLFTRSPQIGIEQQSENKNKFYKKNCHVLQIAFEEILTWKQSSKCQWIV